jgi:hypothetical protein
MAKAKTAKQVVLDSITAGELITELQKLPASTYVMLDEGYAFNNGIDDRAARSIISMGVTTIKEGGEAISVLALSDIEEWFGNA